MAQGKGIILETVVEDLEGEVGTVKSNLSSAKNNSRMKVNKSEKPKLKKENNKKTSRRTVTVDVPTDNTITGPGIDSLKRKLNEIKFEVKEMDEQNKDTTTDADGEMKPNSNEFYIKTPNDNKCTPEKTVTINCEQNAACENQENDKNALNDKSGNLETDQVYREYSRTETNISLTSNQNESEILNGKSNSPKKCTRPKSSNRFSKKEMEMFLPRKSFFSSHDKVLKEAGFHVDSSKERKKPNWRKILKMHTMEELYPVDKVPDTETKNVEFGGEPVSSDEEDDGFSLENVETTMSKEKDEHSVKRKTKKSQKNASAVDKEEYKTLLEYLKYIHENPEEYGQMANFSSKNNDHRHPSRMVRLGRVYRRSRGDRASTGRNSIYLHAINGLKSKLVEPGAEQIPANTADDQSEIEKLKAKAEKWMRGQTTQQLMRAKEFALKDIGEEDVNITKWWHSFKSCHYLRVPKHVEETSTG